MITGAFVACLSKLVTAEFFFVAHCQKPAVEKERFHSNTINLCCDLVAIKN